MSGVLVVCCGGGGVQCAAAKLWQLAEIIRAAASQSIAGPENAQ